MTDPETLLQSSAEEYRQKNEDYGESWRAIGDVLWQMAGEEPVTLESPEDMVRFGLYTRRLDKLFRAFNGEFRAEDLNFESVADSHSDEGVYAHMAAALDSEEVVDR